MRDCSVVLQNSFAIFLFCCNEELKWISCFLVFKLQFQSGFKLIAKQETIFFIARFTILHFCKQRESFRDILIRMQQSADGNKYPRIKINRRIRFYDRRTI